MMRPGRALLAAAAALLVYLFLMTAGVSSMRFDYMIDNAAVIGGVSILVALAVWLLFGAGRLPGSGGGWRSRVLPLAVVLLLLALLAVSEAVTIVLPAIVILFSMVLMTGFSGAWRVLALLPVLLFMLATRELFYFGGMLILIGLGMWTGRLGTTLRELFPRRVGGA